MGLDFKHAIRLFRRHPAFAFVIVTTLALGIGANTAIFSVANGVLLRPLSYPQPDQLIYLTARAGIPVSVPEYLEYQRFSEAFTELGAFRRGEANFIAGERARRVRTAIVDTHLLNALGVQPVQGRLFTSEDSVVTAPALPGASAVAAPVALISHELWQSAFAGRPIVGEQVQVDGRSVEVVGVLARGTDVVENGTEVWLPLGFAGPERLARNNHNLFLVGRLKHGVSAGAAEAELQGLIESWPARTGITPAPSDAGHVGHALVMRPLADEVIGRAGQAIWTLQAVAALVLLLACANVANLLLARSELRQREFAVLSALGASRARLLRKVLAESTLLSLAGCALGLLVARAGVSALVSAFPTSLPRIAEVTIDARVMLVSLAVAIVCAAIFGLAPVIHVRRTASREALGSLRGASARTRRGVRVALVIAETALAVIVVAGAGLLLRTVKNLATVDAGFDRSRLVTFSVTLPRSTFDNVARVRGYQRIVEEMRGIPGVAGASAMSLLPLDRQFVRNGTEITNNMDSPKPGIGIDYQRVMTGFFETTRIPIVQGRGFESTDVTLQDGVAVVNETFANTYWKGVNPIGQRLRPGGTQPWFTVVGVAKDVKQAGVDQPVGPETYLLVDQLATDSPTTWVAISATTMHLVVRTSLPLTSLAPAITQAVRGVDPGVPVARLREMDEVFVESIRRPRLLAELVGVFGALALLLAGIGTFGVLSYMVTERRREIGVRMALGATRSSVLADVMKRGLVTTTAGVVVGLAATIALNRLMAPLLFGVRPTDAATFVAVVLTIFVVASAASGVPAWRASRLDPNHVIREE